MRAFVISDYEFDTDFENRDMPVFEIYIYVYFIYIYTEKHR